MFHSKNLNSHARRCPGLILTPLVLLAVAIVAPAPAAFTAIKPAVNPPLPTIWSVPVNLGPVINSTASDQQPAISPDGLSLYFTSNRLPGLGGFDIYVTQRASVYDPWGSPMNAGPALNTTFDEGNAAFSRDGRSLFFQSKRPGGLGGIDIWVARRSNPQDDFGWQPAVNLGPAVNSAADDNGLCYFEDEVRGTRQLFFGSSRPGLGGTDIYVSQQMPDGSFAPATRVTELSGPSNETDPSIRPDGLEIFFHSNRTGSIGTAFDIWVATRASTLDAWSTPVSVGSAINTASVENNPYLSSDGMTLLFTSDRAGGFGGPDLYMSTRMLPVVRSRNISVAANNSCAASISPSDVDDGSFDPVNGGPITLSLDPAAGGPFGLGQHTVRLIATDDRGVTNSAIAIVDVVDQTPPAITAPVGVTVASDAGSCGTFVSDAVLGTATASDNCSVTTARSGVPAGNFFPVGTTTVTYTATDGAGNATSAQQTVTVIDDTPPVISGASADKPALWPPNHQLVDVTVSYAATDNCGEVNSALSVSSNESANSVGDGNTATDWEIVDAHHVRLRAERAGRGSGRIYTIAITATDSHGNSSSQILTVGVPHN